MGSFTKSLCYNYPRMCFQRVLLPKLLILTLKIAHVCTPSCGVAPLPVVLLPTTENLCRIFLVHWFIHLSFWAQISAFHADISGKTLATPAPDTTMFHKICMSMQKHCDSWGGDPPMRSLCHLENPRSATGIKLAYFENVCSQCDAIMESQVFIREVCWQ